MNHLLTGRNFSRRTVFKAAALAATAGIVGSQAPQALALGPVLGTVIDFSAGVPSARSIKAAGHMGAVRYVSQRRPDAQWMVGKPVSLNETKANAAEGLATASIYQYGRAETADWLRGAAGAAVHAPQAIALHKAAGGPTGRPIYIAIDDNPTRAQYDNQIRPYLQAFSSALQAAGYQTGVYGNYNVIDWAIADGIGSFFWMHDWGSGGRIHPRTTIHQLPGNQQRTIDGVTVDINNVYARDWGQWTPGSAGTPLPAQSTGGQSVPAAPADALAGLSSQLQSAIPGMPSLPQVSGGAVNFQGSSVNAGQISQGMDILTTLGKAFQ